MWTRHICLPQTDFFFSFSRLINLHARAFSNWFAMFNWFVTLHMCAISLWQWVAKWNKTRCSNRIVCFNQFPFLFSLSPVFRHWRGLLWLGSPIPDFAWINGGTILFEKHPVLDWSILGTCSLSDRQLVASAYYSSTSITDLMVKHI